MIFYKYVGNALPDTCFFCKKIVSLVSEIQKMIDEDFKNMCDKAFANLTDEEIESFLGVILKIKHNFD